MELIDDFKHFNHFLVMFFFFSKFKYIYYNIHDIKKLVKDNNLRAITIIKILFLLHIFFIIALFVDLILLIIFGVCSFKENFRQKKSKNEKIMSFVGNISD